MWNACFRKGNEIYQMIMNSIIEIDQKYKVGDLFSEIYGFNDPIIEINITPNRSDCLSVRGIARDLAAAGSWKSEEI